jgi:predicted Rossmann fold flavoprotein
VEYDVVIIGGGAAGLICAATAGMRVRRVLVLEHTAKIGEKIRISGGGRCNFTNLNCAPEKYLSQNPHFCRSALKRYTQHDFIDLVDRHGIAWHEKTLGQLFCDNSAQDIIDMLLHMCDDASVEIKTDCTVRDVIAQDGGFLIATAQGDIAAQSLVIATGGLSIPKIGATGFGYDLARQFGHNIVPMRAGLVPLVFDPLILDQTRTLSGVSIDPVRATAQDGTMFDEALLFTHRGLSGPAILQISSYWSPGQAITIDMMPGRDVFAWLKDRRTTRPKAGLTAILGEALPKRVAEWVVETLPGAGAVCNMADLPDRLLRQVADKIQHWRVIPSGSEGYRTAEVTLGGVDTRQISSKTFESVLMPGLFFIGEVLDVTGHLGGYNFQWAWSSGYCAGQAV